MKMSNRKLTKALTEYRKLFALYEVHLRVTEFALTKMKIFEKEFFETVKENGPTVVDHTILHIVMSKTSSTSYLALYNKALEIAPEEIVRQLKDMKTNITKSNTTESLEILDPRLVAIKKEIQSKTFEELLGIIKQGIH